MKTRYGFVSNSSSSSFVAVGIKRDWQNNTNNTLFNAVIKAAVPEWIGSDINDMITDILEEVDYGQYKSTVGELIIWANEDGEMSMVGTNIRHLIEQNFRLSEIKQLCIQKIKDIGITVPLSQIDFEIGESG